MAFGGCLDKNACGDTLGIVKVGESLLA